MPVPTQQEVHDVYQELYDALTDGYWAASTIKDKDKLKGLSEAVYEILTELNADGLKSRTAEYRAARAGVMSVTERLNKLAEEIGDMVHRVDVAAQVIAGISKALELGAKYFV